VSSFEPVLILYVPVFLFSLTLHEFAHAWTARMAGDMTAAYKGRLTLNPLAHIDLFGTIILPAIALFSQMPLLGWAKPVPVNELRFRRPGWRLWVSLAGPISNLLIVVTTALILKVVLGLGGLPAKQTFVLAVGFHVQDFTSALCVLAFFLINLNIVLALFNMMPIPPLDGSAVLFELLIRRNQRLWPLWVGLHQFGFFVLYALILMPPTRKALHYAYSVPAEAIINWVIR
jgi:Zn-dependent protease